MPANDLKFMRRREVESRTGLPTSSLYDLIMRGQLPRPFALSANRVAWLETEVNDWQVERLKARTAARPAAAAKVSP